MGRCQSLSLLQAVLLLMAHLSSGAAASTTYSRHQRACEEGGYCSVGHVKHYVGDVREGEKPAETAA